MKNFEYGDEEIGVREVTFTVSSMVIGFGVLTLPNAILRATGSSDGVLSIVIAGAIAFVFCWMIAKLTARFPKTGFRDIMAALTNKTAANIATLFFALYTLLLVSYETRGVASISQLYLFDTTPIEAIALAFLLVLVYGVSGPSISLIRLNLIYLPIVLAFVILVMSLNLYNFNYHNLKPMLRTGWTDLLRGTNESLFSFIGFEILLFYNAFINQPARTVKASMIGLVIPFALYIVSFVIVCGVFSMKVVENTLYPMAELAKQVEVPGGFFERFESLFFIMWVMALFNTAAMAFDVTLLAIRSVFPKPSRMTYTLFLAPVIFLLAMQPRNQAEIKLFVKWISYMGIAVGWLLPVLLLGTAMARRVRGDG